MSWLVSNRRRNFLVNEVFTNWDEFILDNDYKDELESKIEYKEFFIYFINKNYNKYCISDDLESLTFNMYLSLTSNVNNYLDLKFIYEENIDNLTKVETTNKFFDIGSNIPNSEDVPDTFLSGASKTSQTLPKITIIEEIEELKTKLNKLKINTIKKIEKDILNLHLIKEIYYE